MQRSMLYTPRNRTSQEGWLAALFQQRGQAPLPDLFFSTFLFLSCNLMSTGFQQLSPKEAES